MLLRMTVPALVLLYATGCCCCGGGGGSSSSSGKSGWQERLEKEASEALAEKLIEAATDAEDIEIDSKTGEIRLKTAEGEAVMNSNDQGGTLSFKGADGQTFDLVAGMNGELPEGFPYTVPSGAKIAMSNKMVEGDKVVYMVMMEHPSGDMGTIVKHWEDQLAAEGKVSRTEMTQDGNKAVMLGVQNGRSGAVIASADGTTSSTVTVEVPK